MLFLKTVSPTDVIYDSSKRVRYNYAQEAAKSCATGFDERLRQLR